MLWSLPNHKTLTAPGPALVLTSVICYMDTLPVCNPPSSGAATHSCLALLGVDFHVPCLVLEGLELVLQLAAKKSIKTEVQAPVLESKNCRSGQ